MIRCEHNINGAFFGWTEEKNYRCKYEKDHIGKHHWFGEYNGKDLDLWWEDTVHEEPIRRTIQQEVCDVDCSDWPAMAG